ncbi:MAG: RNA polymerase sigma factor [Bacteroidota bacterium]
MIVPPPNEQWEEAYQNYREELEQFVQGRVADEVVEDLLQEVWGAFASSLETQTIEQPRAWLYRVTRNRITDHFRRQKGKPAFADLTPEIAPETEDRALPNPDDTWEDIFAALEELPPNQREVFVRNELDGETLREIADDLGLPLKTVISRKGYARRRLQDLLWEVYDNYFGEE